jgi:hypothetical protein
VQSAAHAALVLLASIALPVVDFRVQYYWLVETLLTLSDIHRLMGAARCYPAENPPMFQTEVDIPFSAKPTATTFSLLCTGIEYLVCQVLESNSEVEIPFVSHCIFFLFVFFLLPFRTHGCHRISNSLM